MLTHSSLGRSAAWLALAVGLLLLIPLVAMRFTAEVSWKPGDFVLAGALLFGAGMSYLVVARRAPRRMQRIAAALVIAFLLVAVWAELAVGIFS
jgi:peptidoglycan/LPS O-acetylase OafA/YrhL